MRPRPRATTVRRERRRPLWPAALVAVAGLALAAAGLLREAPSAPQPPQQALPGHALRAERGHQPAPAQAPEPVAAPRRLVIPAIGVSAPLVRLGLNPDRTLEVPTTPGDAGWYVHGSRPGEIGPAVIAGHVDSAAGPDVFYRLGELRRGDRIRVRRADGSSVSFTVEGLERRSKSDFPTRRVYGPTARPVLRLITCSGPFDTATGHYDDNTIVYAAPS